jgi:hypothetical protein
MWQSRNQAFAPKAVPRGNRGLGVTMEKSIRCTVCTWRGPMTVAESAPRIRASQIPPPMEEVQQVYEERQSESVSYGSHPLPPCPMCGHHTVAVKLHGYRAAV